MKMHEIYGLLASATQQEIETAARQHAVECARGQHGAIGATRTAVPKGHVWGQAQNCWVPPTFALDICHRLEILEDRDGGYYAEVYEDGRRQRLHTTETYPTAGEAGDAAREWDRRRKVGKE